MQPCALCPSCSGIYHKGVTAPRSSIWTLCQAGRGQTLLGLGAEAWGWGLCPVLCVPQLSTSRHWGSQCEVRLTGGSPFLRLTCPMGPAHGLESPMGTCAPFSGERPFPPLRPAGRVCCWGTCTRAGLVPLALGLQRLFCSLLSSSPSVNALGTGGVLICYLRPQEATHTGSACPRVTQNHSWESRGPFM